MHFKHRSLCLILIYNFVWCKTSIITLRLLSITVHLTCSVHLKRWYCISRGFSIITVFLWRNLWLYIMQQLWMYFSVWCSGSICVQLWILICFNIFRLWSLWYKWWCWRSIFDIVWCTVSSILSLIIIINVIIKANHRRWFVRLILSFPLFHSL